MDFSSIGKELAALVKDAPPRLCAGLAIATGFVLFGPGAAVRTIGLDDIAQPYKGIIGFVFVVSCCLFVAFVASNIIKGIQVWYQVRWRGNKLLKSLSTAEKVLLAEVIIQGNPAIYAQLSNGAASALVMKNVIVRSSQISGMGQAFPHVIQPWAHSILSRHPEYLSADGDERSERRASARIRR